MKERRLPNSIDCLSRFVATVLIIFLGGCATQLAPPPHPIPPPAEPCCEPACDPVPEAFLESLALARRPLAKNISRDLVAILDDNQDLRWNDQGHVLMTTWSRAKYYPPKDYPKGQVFTLYGDTFLTAVPEVQSWCSAYMKKDPDNLEYRLYQLLGLQPPSDHPPERVFVEIWVDPVDLFRPCADPEITDHECQVSVPFVGAKSPPKPTSEPPWLCPSPFRPLPPQVTGAFVQVNMDVLWWICEWWKTAYGNACPAENYPWTALGYTFDWGDLENPKGPSEFVAVKGSSVVMESLTPASEYCLSP